MPGDLLIKRAASWCAVFFTLFLSAHFFLGQMHRASLKPFWADETHGLEHSIRLTNTASLIVRGAKFQGSPSPLDYCLIKFLDNIKDRVDFFGFSQEVYFRLAANAVTTLTPLIVLLLFLKSTGRTAQNTTIHLLQIFLLCLFPVIFFTKHWVYYFAAEMRPYALWNCLWMLSLVGSLTQRKVFTFFALTGLALTATAGLFQIGVLLLSALILSLVLKELPRAWKKHALYYGIPLLLALYYATKSGQWPYPQEEDYWGRFFKLWSHESVTIPLMLVGFALLWINKTLRQRAIVPLAVMLLYLAGPAIVALTLAKGFFFTERQFIYYDLTKPLFLLILTVSLPYYAPDLKRKRHWIIAAGVLAIALSMAFPGKNINRLKEVFDSAGKVKAGQSALIYEQQLQ